MYLARRLLVAELMAKKMMQKKVKHDSTYHLWWHRYGHRVLLAQISGHWANMGSTVVSMAIMNFTLVSHGFRKT